MAFFAVIASATEFWTLSNGAEPFEDKDDFRSSSEL